MALKYLFAAPKVNPINRKALSIPYLNPINVYGRVFHLSWLSFFLAFWSWYAWPPLLTQTIKKDLKLSDTDISNSNIVALLATLLTRFIAGPACDRFGPRLTFIGCLLLGAIPTALAGTASSAGGVMALRFFTGILGGSFVPCQVYSTGFFDKKVVGRANAITAGLGNAGGGVTYFVMPAVLDSLVAMGHTPHVSWRVAFIVPFILICATSAALFFLCPDTPSGKWSERHFHAEQSLQEHGVRATIVDIPAGTVAEKDTRDGSQSPSGSTQQGLVEQKGFDEKKHSFSDNEAQLGEQQMLDTARGEVVQKPTWKEAMPVIFSPQTWVLALCYFVSFGSELAVNSVLGSFYAAHFKSLGQTGSGKWAAMFGLLNVVTRPLGGYISDKIYVKGGVWGKKMWIHSLGVVAGVFLLIIGLVNPNNQSTMFGLVAGFAIFLEAGNGANFSLVPHVHPHANGIVSGIVGGVGNFGGVIGNIIFRFRPKTVSGYGEALWILGILAIAINVAVCWIKPIPKGQIGGR